MNKYMMVKFTMNILNELIVNERKEGQTLYFNVVGQELPFKGEFDGVNFSISYLENDTWFIENSMKVVA